jgi:hypothetical protein
MNLSKTHFSSTRPYAAFAYPELSGALRLALRQAPFPLSTAGRVTAASCEDLARLERSAGFSPAGGWACLLELSEGLYLERVDGQLIPTCRPSDLPSCDRAIRQALLRNPGSSLKQPFVAAELAQLLGLTASWSTNPPSPAIQSLIDGTLADLLGWVLVELASMPSHNSYALSDLARLLRTLVQMARGPLEASLSMLASVDPRGSASPTTELLTEHIPVHSSAVWSAVALEMLQRWLVPAAAVTLVDDATRFAPFPDLSSLLGDGPQ